MSRYDMKNIFTNLMLRYIEHEHIYECIIVLNILKNSTNVIYKSKQQIDAIKIS